MNWLNAPDKTPEDKVGFVYAVTRLEDDMVYYGIKTYWKVVKYPPLKGKKNKRHKTKESDWREYNTSNTYLQEELVNNPKAYKCEILYECDSVTDMKAREAYLQLTAYFSGNWNRVFNETINLRLRIRKEE